MLAAGGAGRCDATQHPARATARSQLAVEGPEHRAAFAALSAPPSLALLLLPTACVGCCSAMRCPPHLALVQDYDVSLLSSPALYFHWLASLCYSSLTVLACLVYSIRTRLTAIKKDPHLVRAKDVLKIRSDLLDQGALTLPIFQRPEPSAEACTIGLHSRQAERDPGGDGGETRGRGARAGVVRWRRRRWRRLWRDSEGSLDVITRHRTHRAAQRPDTAAHVAGAAADQRLYLFCRPGRE